MIENGHDDTIGQGPSPQYHRRFAVHHGIGGDFADGENQRVDGRAVEFRVFGQNGDRSPARSGQLVDELERQDKTTGLVTMCTGGGMGTATIIERI